MHFLRLNDVSCTGTRRIQTTGTRAHITFRSRVLESIIRLRFLLKGCSITRDRVCLKFKLIITFQRDDPVLPRATPARELKAISLKLW